MEHALPFVFWSMVGTFFYVGVTYMKRRSEALKRNDLKNEPQTKPLLKEKIVSKDNKVTVEIKTHKVDKSELKVNLNVDKVEKIVTNVEKVEKAVTNEKVESGKKIGLEQKHENVVVDNVKKVEEKNCS
jgi:hypothetical protein